MSEEMEETGISAKLEQLREERTGRRTSRPLTAEERQNGKQPADTTTPEFQAEHAVRQAYAEEMSDEQPDPLTEAKKTLQADRQRRLQQARQVMERCQAELAELGCELGVTPVYVQQGDQLQPVTLGQIQLRVVDG